MSESDQEIEDENVSEKPSVLLANEKVAGDKLFSFGTPKKTELKKILEKVPKTPSHIRNKMEEAIHKKLFEDDSEESDPFSDSGSEYEAESTEEYTEEDTSSSSLYELGTKKITKSASDTFDSQSDIEVRKKNKKATRRAVRSRKEQSVDSEGSSSEYDSKKVKNLSPRKRKAKQKETVPMKSETKKSKSAYVIKTDDYFYNSSSKAITSNHTLDKLETPRLPQDQLIKLVRNLEISEPHQNSVKKLTENNSQNFNRWLLLLQENFNILLYGLGSKRTLLKDFQEECLGNLPVVVVNGFFPTLSITDITNAILTDVLGIQQTSSNSYIACDLIEEGFQRKSHLHLYMIVHNIEGEMLRNNKTQNVLSRLAMLKNVHLIASIDHINAPLVWDYAKLSKFNFTWWDVTSYMPYLEETSFEGSMLVQKSGTLVLSSLRNVFTSLPANSKGIFLIIAKYQLQQGKNQYYQGIAFKDLYWSCREAFLVSSDMALRAQLTEFSDHKMIKFRRSIDGTEYVLVPLINSLLQKFVDEQPK